SPQSAEAKFCAPPWPASAEQLGEGGFPVLDALAPDIAAIKFDRDRQGQQRDGGCGLASNKSGFWQTYIAASAHVSFWHLATDLQPDCKRSLSEQSGHSARIASQSIGR